MLTKFVSMGCYCSKSIIKKEIKFQKQHGWKFKSIRLDACNCVIMVYTKK